MERRAQWSASLAEIYCGRNLLTLLIHERLHGEREWCDTPARTRTARGFICMCCTRHLQACMRTDRATHFCGDCCELCASGAGPKSPLFCAAERRFHDAPSDNLLFSIPALLLAFWPDLSARTSAPLFIVSRLTCACLRVLYGLTCARAEQSAKSKVLELSDSLGTMSLSSCASPPAACTLTQIMR